MGVTMDIRQLGNADPVSSPIGLGTRAFTGRQSRGAEQEALCIARVHQALDMGIAMLDTADHYGGGQVERLIGRAIAKRRGEAPLPFTSRTSVSACPVFSVALRAGHDFGWHSGTDVNATRPLL
jgi:diketogulonate reductase-like aldo/keto reductase